jgi:signal transduction histidine kinase
MAAEVSNETNERAPIEGDRLATLAHDLRHSLHVIRLGLELLRDAPDKEKRAELCQAMEAEERKASQLLEELLAAAGHDGKQK